MLDKLKRNLIFALIILFFVPLACKDEGVAEIVTKYPDGTAQKINYVVWEKNTKKIVKEVRIYPNGETELEGELKNGLRHGKWTYWYDNRKIWLEENYQEGKKHGKIIEYYKDGEINYIGEFADGFPSGEWTFYDGKGNITSTKKYD